MRNKVVTMILAIFMTMSFIGTGLAMEQGNKRKGKYTYRKVYKACKERGAVETAKPTLNPDAKTQEEWETLFDGIASSLNANVKNPVVKTEAKQEASLKEGVKEVVLQEGLFDEFGCQEEWSKLSDEEITDIFTYLHAHASDSPTPAKCK